MRPIAAALALTLAASTAVAQPNGGDAGAEPAAREHFQRGLQHFRDKEYEAAIREFDAAYALDERSEFLFAMAQAERLSGDCASAVILYRRFLETDPAEMHAEAARESKDKCERALASRPETAPAGAPVAESEPSTPRDDDAMPPAPTPSSALVAPPDQPRSERAAWYRDPVNTTLLGGAAVSLAIGGTFYALSAGDVSDAESSSSYVDYVELMDRAETRRTIAWAGVGAGGVLLSGALLRWWLRDGADAPADLAISVGADGVGIAGEF